MTDEELLNKLRFIDKKHVKKHFTRNLALSVASVILFFVLGCVFWNAAITLIIFLAIFFHELGHFFAFKMFKCKNAMFYFIPLMGGVTSAEARNLSPSQNLTVSLMGPFFGLITAPIAVFFSGVVDAFLPPQTSSIEFFAFYASVTSILTVLNLLPIGFLDGGKVLDILLFSRNYILKLIYNLIGVIGFLAVYYFFGGYLFLILGIVTAATIPLRMNLFKWALKIRTLPKLSIDDLTPEDLAKIRIMMIESGLPEQLLSQKNFPKTLHNAISQARTNSPSIWKSALFFSLYLLIFLGGTVFFISAQQFIAHLKNDDAYMPMIKAVQDVNFYKSLN